MQSWEAVPSVGASSISMESILSLWRHHRRRRCITIYFISFIRDSGKDENAVSSVYLTYLFLFTKFISVATTHL